MDKNKIATAVGFAGGGVFFILNLATKGQVPGIARDPCGVRALDRMLLSSPR